MEPTQQTADYDPEFVLIDPRPIAPERYREIAKWHDCMHPIAAPDPCLEEEWQRVNDLIGGLAHAEARAATLEAQVRELLAGAKPNPFLPADDWGDDDGAVLWWTFPIGEPPYVGSPADCDWDYENTFTHYQKFDLRGYDDERAYRDFASAAPEQPQQPAPQGGGRVGQEGGQHGG